MKLAEVRSRFLQFYEKRGHSITPSASLVPENDQTTLFTGSGMQPMLQYFLGESHPLGQRIVNSQKCFRAEDIDEVGDNRHTTFFEMLGNWSLGDYFKQEQLPWVFEFLTDKEEGLGLDPEKLYITVFQGDEERGLERDETSADIWKELFASKGIVAEVADIGSEERGYRRGITPSERIFFYDAKKNWWSRAGVPGNMPAGEPGGPDSEVFYEFSHIEHDASFGEKCHPNCDCGRFVEIGNSVFMQFKKVEDGFSPLLNENVDFGGGLERLAAAAMNESDVFKTDILFALITEIEKHSSCSYEDAEHQKSFRVVADHIRGAFFMISDGVIPSNSEQGYFARRLLRRAIRHLDLLGSQGGLADLVSILVEKYEDFYKDLREKEEHIKETILLEEKKFRNTLEKGKRELEKILSRSEGWVSGEDAFILFTSYGFPVEVIEEIAQERGVVVDREGFESEFKKHQENSRAGSEKKFKGGLGDASQVSVRYHTATHLLNAALREVLGEHVEQRGSNITPERMRFDFSHPSKLTDEEKSAVEEFVNTAIHDALPVTSEELKLETARERGALGVFGDKYGEVVKVYRIGDGERVVSLEICGGPHVENTQELGVFKIVKEEASSQGVRRIKAILE